MGCKSKSKQRVSSLTLGGLDWWTSKMTRFLKLGNAWTRREGYPNRDGGWYGNPKVR